MWVRSWRGKMLTPNGGDWRTPPLGFTFHLRDAVDVHMWECDCEWDPIAYTLMEGNGNWNIYWNLPPRAKRGAALRERTAMADERAMP